MAPSARAINPERLVAAAKSDARKSYFIEADQTDPTCPVPVAKRFSFRRGANHFKRCAIPSR